VLKAVQVIPLVPPVHAHHPVILPEDHLHTAVAAIPAEAAVIHQAAPHPAAHHPVVHLPQAAVAVVRRQEAEDSCKKIFNCSCGSF
jgi:hypothetical protein